MAGAPPRPSYDVETERWFRDRGIPLLYADESPWDRVRRKAMWFLAVVAALLSIDHPGSVVRSAVLWSVGAAIVPVAMLLRRGRLAAFVIAPVVPALIGRDWYSAIESAVGTVTVLALTYLVVGYGLMPLFVWMARRLSRSLPELRSAAARALPMLLLFVTFLLFTTESWQVAGRLRGLPYLLTILLFVGSGLAFVATRVRGEIDGLTAFDSWAEIDDLATTTPVAWCAADPDGGRHGAPVEIPLSARERRSVLLVLLSNQVIMAAIVAAVVFCFFVLLGFFSIDPAVTKAWLGDAPKVWVRWTYRAREMVLTEELVRVAGFLAAFSGFYFAVFSASDPTIREGLTDEGTTQLRTACAVRHRYRTERGSPARR